MSMASKSIKCKAGSNRKAVKTVASARARPRTVRGVPAQKETQQSPKGVDETRLLQLNAGLAPTAVLAECLALDFAALMYAVLPQMGASAIKAMHEQASTGITRRMALAAELMLAELDTRTLQNLRGHASDTVRGWCCYVVGMQPGLGLAQRLEQIRQFADDAHFGVREWAWLALRPHLAQDLPLTIELLTPWTRDASERIRRFACEALRPRGVWCAHIESLKDEPEQALVIVEALRADSSRYVQDSVANWLNDASKTQPKWVSQVCKRWMRESPYPSTERICARALRTLQRKQQQ